MTTIKCSNKYCEGVIDSTDNFCRHCGKPSLAVMTEIQEGLRLARISLSGYPDITKDQAVGLMDLVMNCTFAAFTRDQVVQLTGRPHSSRTITKMAYALRSKTKLRIVLIDDNLFIIRFSSK